MGHCVHWGTQFPGTQEHWRKNRLRSCSTGRTPILDPSGFVSIFGGDWSFLQSSQEAKGYSETFLVRFFREVNKRKSSTFYVPSWIATPSNPPKPPNEEGSPLLCCWFSEQSSSLSPYTLSYLWCAWNQQNKSLQYHRFLKGLVPLLGLGLFLKLCFFPH